MDKEQLLMKKIIDLINSSGIYRCRILNFIKKNDINSVVDFMNIKRPSFYHDRKYANMGPKTFQRIEEIQKIIEREYKEHKCNCKLCKLDVLRQKALASDDIELVKDTLKKFADLWLNADFDRSYYKCILDGSWPQSEEILTKSLEKTKKHVE